MKLYERLLTQLADQLNELHDSKHSVRYWRIILGPLLASFIGIFLDRYRSLCVAVDSGKVTNTWISPEFPEEYLANDFSEFRENCSEDDYNHCFFSQIIKSSKTIPYESVNNEDVLVSESRKTAPFQKNGFNSTIFKGNGVFSFLLPYQFWDRG